MRRRGRQLERGRRKRLAEKRQLRSTLRCGRGPGKNLQEKIKVKKKFIEEQNNVQKTALAKGDRMKSADRYS